MAKSKRQAFIDNKKQKETGPFGINGYFPLFDTKEGAVSASPTPTENRSGENTYGYHIHSFDGTILYMPNGLKLGVTQFHGNWDGEIIPEVQIEQSTPPSILNSKRREFIEKKEKGKKGKSNLIPCLFDIVIAIDVSGSTGYGNAPPYAPPGSLAESQNLVVKGLIDAFAPQMAIGNLQMGIAQFSYSSKFDNVYEKTNPGTGYAGSQFPNWSGFTPSSYGTVFRIGFGPQSVSNNMLFGDRIPIEYKTQQGKFLSTSPNNLKDVVDNIRGDGGTCVRQGLFIGRQLLNRTQTDTTDCDLGNRSGQPGYKRIVILITDADRGVDDAEQYGVNTNNHLGGNGNGTWAYVGAGAGSILRPGGMKTAEDLWEDLDSHFYYQEHGNPYSNATMTGPHGYGGGHGKVETYVIRTESSSGQVTPAQELEWRKKIQPIAGKSGTTPGILIGTETINQTTAYGSPYNEENLWNNTPLICCTYDATGGDYTHTFAGNLTTLLTPTPSGVPAIVDQIIHSVCPPGPPESWDCSGPPNYNCSDPGTGNGQYLDLTTCQAACVHVPSWDCDGMGNCYDPGTGNGQYSLLVNCQANCFPPTWNCTPSGCVDPGDGTGQFSILQFSPYSCEAQCGWYECVYTGLPSPGIPGQSCVSHSGVAPIPLSLNQYLSLSTCLTGCTGPPPPPIPVPNTWNCVIDAPIGGLPTYSCIDPLDGSGQYSSLVSCQANCGPQVQPVKESWNCDDVSGCYDPGTGLGQYATLAACQAICPFPIPPPTSEPTPSPPRRDTGY